MQETRDLFPANLHPAVVATVQESSSFKKRVYVTRSSILFALLNGDLNGNKPRNREWTRNRGLG